MRIFLWSSVLLGALVLGSCTSGTEGIFASIAREQKIVSLGGIDEHVTITSLTEFKNTYYAAGGAALFTKSTSDTVTNWTSSTVGGSQAVTSVAVAGTVNVNQAVFAAAAGRLFVSTDGSTWNDFTSQLGLASNASVNTVVPVRNSDGYTSDRLLVIASVPASAASSSTIPNYNSVCLVTGFSGSITQTGPVTLIAHEGTTDQTAFQSAVFAGVRTNAGEYYIASETYLWHLDSSFSNLGLVTNSTSFGGFGGLLDVQRSGTEYLFLTTIANNNIGGGLFRWTSPTGTSQAFSALVTNQKDSNDDSMTLTTMMYNPENDSVWIGTGPVTLREGDGYAEYTFNSSNFSTTPTTNTDNYDSTVLPTSAVGCFYINATSNVYFLGTSAEGLWRWDSTAKTWTQQ